MFVCLLSRYINRLIKMENLCVFCKLLLRRTAEINRNVSRCRFRKLYSTDSPRKTYTDLSQYPVERIRNFSIIAHIDHGKSTLADRLLEITDTIPKAKSNKQVLDKLQVERERGITVKAQTASLFYNYKGEEYLLNLIDTPGHVDFNYEVSRSLAACQGVLLLVDANQGVQAQTVANFYLAFESDLTVIPVLNKIDLKGAQPDLVKQQMKTIFDIQPDSVHMISAKVGTGVEDLLKAVIENIPPPTGTRYSTTRALLFDSTYDQYRGVIGYLSLIDGVLSKALGQGFRLGFLGLLHMDVFSQRLEQEHNASVITTCPNVPYKVKITGAKNIKKYSTDEITILNPCHLPDTTIISEMSEPMVNGTILMPDDFLGDVMSLCLERRGVMLDQSYVDNKRIMIKIRLPLNEILVDFYDELKSLTSGYASFDYEDSGYEVSNLVKVDFLINSRPVEELSLICHTTRARQIARNICLKLSESIRPQLFLIVIQASVGSKIIARENIKALRKDVLAKCYGGDITRKEKLLRRQAEGKKKMRKIGNVEIPKDAFIKALKR